MKGGSPLVYMTENARRTRAATEEVHYSDIDMTASRRDGKFVFSHKNGEPYP